MPAPTNPSADREWPRPKYRNCPVDESLLAGFVFLPHNHIQFLAPALVQLAEPIVAIAIRIRIPVFLPTQLQGHVAVTPELLAHGSKVG